MARDTHITARVSSADKKEIQDMAFELDVPLSDLIVQGAKREGKRLLNKKRKAESNG